MLKVGSKVKIVSTAYEYKKKYIGTVGVIIDIRRAPITDCLLYVVDSIHHSNGSPILFYSDEVELCDNDKITPKDIITTLFFVDQCKRAKENGYEFDVGYKQDFDRLTITLNLYDNRIGRRYVHTVFISNGCTNLGDARRTVMHGIDELYRRADTNRYIDNDVKNTEEMYKIMWPKVNPYLTPKIKNVIFNDPATIVFWTDGTKTVVKCQDDDIFDPEKGLAMAISKKALGNKYDYCHVFLHWLKKYEKQNNDIQYELKCSGTFTEAGKAAKKIQEALYTCFNSPKDAFEYKGKREKVQKAYDILAQFQNDSEVPNRRLDDVLRYLHDALED